MALISYRPTTLLRDLQEEMNRLFEDVPTANNSDTGLTSASWAPRIDIQETASSYEVYADLPGLQAKDIKVSVENNVLTIEGAREVKREDTQKNYHRTERLSGTFCRQFNLPVTVDSDRIHATCNLGVLELTIPKVEKADKRYVEINEG